MDRVDDLIKIQADIAKKNDENILKALSKLEEKVGLQKKLPCVKDLAQLAGVSLNTVRTRPWALARLRTVKENCKASRSVKKEAIQFATRSSQDEAGTFRKQVESLLRQNALLYEEVLYLRKIVSNKDAELAELRSSRELSSNVRYLK